MRKICETFNVDIHAIGVEAFTSNVEDLNFRKAKLAANLTGLDRYEQKMLVLEACDRVAAQLAAQGGQTDYTKLKTLSRISTRFGLKPLRDLCRREVAQYAN